MPSPIVHIEILYQLRSQCNLIITPELLLGVISPDAIHMRPHQTWEDKAVTHFYEQADVSFEQAIETAKQTIRCDSSDFKLGYLTHLYTDYLWRQDIYTPYFNAYKDQLIRQELHALYYHDMQRVDTILLKEAEWLEEVTLKLQRIESMNCLPLLSRDEIDKWRLKVLNDDFKEKVLLDFEFEIFEMIQIRTFIQTCCEFLKIHLNQFETSNYC